MSKIEMLLSIYVSSALLYTCWRVYLDVLQMEKHRAQKQFEHALDLERDNYKTVALDRDMFRSAYLALRHNSPTPEGEKEGT